MSGRATLNANAASKRADFAVATATIAVTADRMIVLGIASRTAQAVTGVSSYSVGIAGEPSKFGESLGVALASTKIGVTGPTTFNSNTPARVTANGANFTGGKPPARKSTKG